MLEFSPRLSVEPVEEGSDIEPKFDASGLIPVVTSDADTGEVLIMGVMSPEALSRSIETAEAHYWSRSRQCLWHKGATSGLVQRIGADLADAVAGPGHRAHRAARPRLVHRQ